MSRKLLLLMLLALLVGTLNLAMKVEKAKASGTIYIRADGRIDPPDAPISTFDNVTYTLTGNIISDAHGIFLERSNMTLDGAGFTLLGTRNGTGIYMNGRSNVTVIDTTVNNFTFGFSLGDSFYNNIIANNITNNEYAIIDVGSWFYPSNNNITANNITANNEGIDLSHSSNNTITGNNITAGFDVAILLTFSSNYNSISQNNIANNGKGIWLHESSNNSIVSNNFVNNTQQVYVEKSGYTNFWDSSYPSGGNYWSNYKGIDLHSGQYQNVTGSDGVGDTPQIIDANNTDNYPLMVQYVIPEFPSFLILLPFMIATLLAVIIYRRKHAQRE
jgi:parallel beta-helix repeat protein